VTTAVDPIARKRVIGMFHAGEPISRIRSETGLTDKDIRSIIDGGPAVVGRPDEPVPAEPRPAKLSTPEGPYVTVLRAGDLFVDLTYQRPVDERRVDKMVAEYDVAMVGILEVSARGDGRYADRGDGHTGRPTARQSQLERQSHRRRLLHHRLPGARQRRRARPATPDAACVHRRLGRA
jgi:hypothetical protein